QPARFFHVCNQVSARSGALTDAGGQRTTTVITGDPGDHFLNEYRLADAGADEQTDLAALNIRCQQIDDLNARLEHLGLGFKLIERGRASMNAPVFLGVELLAFIKVQALTHRVEHAAERLIANGNLNRLPCVHDFAAAHDTVRSEEHTSELQSRFDLVCRLLLEKKKK